MRPSATQARKGFSLIELLCAITVIAILVAVAMPHYSVSRKAANETSAIESMRVLVTAQETFRHRQSPPSYGPIADLAATGILSDDLGGGAKRGYTFVTFGAPDKDTYAIVAMPQANAGDRWFYIDQSGTIRYREGDVPDASSPPLQ